VWQRVRLFSHCVKMKRSEAKREKCEGGGPPPYDEFEELIRAEVELADDLTKRVKNWCISNDMPIDWIELRQFRMLVLDFLQFREGSPMNPIKIEE